MKKLNLYLVTRNSYSWDEYIGFVIAAKDEAEARVCARLRDSDRWPHDRYVTCELIGKAEKTVEAGIIFDSFNAG